MVKKSKKVSESFFVFNRSRWIIFIIVFLLLPLTLTYSSSPCKLFEEPGTFEAICHITKPAFIILPLAIYDNMFFGYANLITLIPGSMINLILALGLSYPLNLIYQKMKK